MEDKINELVSKIEANASLENIHISEDMYDSLYHQAYHYYQNGKYSQSKSVFRFLSFFDLKNAKYWMGLGASDQMLKNYEAAIDSYKIALVLNESNPHVYFLIADCFIALEKIDEAMEVLKNVEESFVQDEKYIKLISHVALIRQSWENQSTGDIRCQTLV